MMTKTNGDGSEDYSDESDREVHDKSRSLDIIELGALSMHTWSYSLILWDIS